MNRKKEKLKITSVLFGIIFVVILVFGLLLFFLDNSRPGDPDSLGIGAAAKTVWKILVVGAMIVFGLPSLCISIIAGIKSNKLEKEFNHNEDSSDTEIPLPDSQ